MWEYSDQINNIAQPIDPFAAIFVVIGVVIFFSLLVGWALAPKKPADQPLPEYPGLILVDLQTTLMRLEIATNAIETVLRQKGFKRDADGAMRAREAMRHELERMKDEYLQKQFLENLGKSKSDHG